MMAMKFNMMDVSNVNLVVINTVKSVYLAFVIVVK